MAAGKAQNIMAETDQYYETISLSESEEDKLVINDFQAIEGEIIDYGVSESEDEEMPHDHPHSPAEITYTLQDHVTKSLSVAVVDCIKHHQAEIIDKITFDPKKTTVSVANTSSDAGLQETPKKKTITESVNKTPMRSASIRNLDEPRYNNALGRRKNVKIDLRNNTGLVGLKVRPKYVYDLNTETNAKVNNYKKDLLTTKFTQLLKNGITIKPVVDKEVENKDRGDLENTVLNNRKTTNDQLGIVLKNETKKAFENKMTFEDNKEVPFTSRNSTSNQGIFNTLSSVAQNDKQSKLHELNLTTSKRQCSTNNNVQNSNKKKIRKQRNSKIGKEQKPKLSQQKIKSAVCIRQNKKISSTPSNINQHTLKILKMNKMRDNDNLKPDITENCAKHENSNTINAKTIPPKVMKDVATTEASIHVNHDERNANILPNATLLRNNCNNKPPTDNNHTSQVPNIVKYKRNETIPHSEELNGINAINTICQNKNNIQLTDKTAPITNTAICNQKSNFYNSMPTEPKSGNIQQVTNMSVISEAPAEATKGLQQKKSLIQIIVTDRNPQIPISISEKANYMPDHGTKHSMSNNNNIIQAKKQQYFQYNAPDFRPNIRPHILRVQMRPPFPRNQIPRPPFPPHRPPPNLNFNPIPPNMHPYSSQRPPSNTAPIFTNNNSTPLPVFNNWNIPRMSKETVNDISGPGGRQCNNVNWTLPLTRPPPPYPGIHSDNTIIGRNAEGLVKKISLTPSCDLEQNQGGKAVPLESLKKPGDRLNYYPISTMQEMFDTLQKGIGSADLKRSTADVTQRRNRQRAATDITKYIPGPLSKKSQNGSMPTQIADHYVTTPVLSAHKGYSAPVLPIQPSYNLSQMPHVDVTNDIAQEENKLKYIKTHFALPETIQSEGIKKISLEEYKKRANCK